MSNLLPVISLWLSLTGRQNIYTAHHFESAYSPPLLALLSTTSPSASLREFISTRGPGFILNPGATFADDVLRRSYSSSYPTALNLQPGPPNAGTFSSTLPNYYDLKVPQGGSVKHTPTHNTLLLVLILGFSGAIGFIVGVVMMLFRKRHGWIWYARPRRRSAGLRDKTNLVGDYIITNMHTRREKRRPGKRYTSLRGTFS